MVRELGPQNIHVAHVIIDSVIDREFIAQNFPDIYAPKAEEGILNPEHIAENYWYLALQTGDVWAHKLD